MENAALMRGVFFGRSSACRDRPSGRHPLPGPICRLRHKSGRQPLPIVVSMKAKSLQRTGIQLGFTLIELLIAIAIVGILAALAVPSYVNYLRRGAAEEATAALADARVTAEQFYLDKKTYDGMPCPVPTSKFKFDCGKPTDTEYKITATGSGNMDSFVYDIDQSGLRTTAGPWGSGNCWITKKGDSC